MIVLDGLLMNGGEVCLPRVFSEGRSKIRALVFVFNLNDALTNVVSRTKDFLTIATTPLLSLRLNLAPCAFSFVFFFRFL